MYLLFDKIIFVLFTVALISFSYIAITFYREKEKRASFISFLSFVFIGLVFLLNYLLDYDNKHIVNIAAFSVVSIALIIFIIPFKNRKNIKPGIVLNRFDERDVMFSRVELIPETDRFIEYYT